MRWRDDFNLLNQRLIFIELTVHVNHMFTGSTFWLNTNIHSKNYQSYCQILHTRYVPVRDLYLKALYPDPYEYVPSSLDSPINHSHNSNPKLWSPCYKRLSDCEFLHTYNRLHVLRPQEHIRTFNVESGKGTTPLARRKPSPSREAKKQLIMRD